MTTKKAFSEPTVPERYAAYERALAIFNKAKDAFENAQYDLQEARDLLADTVDALDRGDR